VPEFEPVRQMIEWLADQDADVRHAMAARLNWDSAVPVLRWIVSQTDCDAGTAASILWLGSVEYYASKLLAGERILPSEVWDLVQEVLRRFREGAYVRRELSLFQHWETAPERYLAALGGRPDPLNLPGSLFEPASGRPPVVPEACDPERSAHVWDLLASLGTYAGRRPAQVDGVPL
jgi:hypothetical protein